MRSRLKALLARIEAFSNAEKAATPGGGYAPVNQTEIEELASILRDMIALKYQADADGDVPVEFQIVDRTRFERTHFFAIPYTHDAKRAADYEEAITDAMTNVSIATQKLRVLLDCRRRHALKEAKENAGGKS